MTNTDNIMSDPADIEVIYDSSDPDTQWRCHMHTISKPHTLAMFIAAPVLLIIAGMNPFLAALLVTAPYVLFLFLIHYTIKKRTKGPRLCTTAISADGLRDTTPDSDKTYSWKDVKNIEISSGDVYFFVPFGDIFVPRSAFKDTNEAKAFYQCARNLWKQPMNLIGDTKTLRLADFEAEEEEKWKQFEEDVKKQKESTNNGSE